MTENPFMHPDYGQLLNNRKVLITHCDPKTEQTIRELFRHQGAEFLIWNGKDNVAADVLICGIENKSDISSDDLGDFISSCVKNTATAISCCLPHMKRQRYGTIVQICAPYGLYCIPGNISMATGSESVAALIRSTAMDVCRYNIRANNLLMPYSLVQPDPDPDLQLLRRAGTQEDVAKAALFLATPMSSFLTGETLPVNGGGFLIGHNQKWQNYMQLI